MTNGADSQQKGNWLESCNFVQVFRTFRMAVHPTKLVLALLAVLVSWVWGRLLDRIWAAADHTRVFEDWSAQQADCIGSALAAVTHGELGIGPGGLIGSLMAMLQGTSAVLHDHTWFAILYFVPLLFVWAFLGGAVCRIAAVQFARDEKIGAGEAISFVKQRYFGGFLLAPLLPLLMVLLVGVLLVIGGMFLSIPYVGDILASLVFGLAIFGGVVIALTLLGALVGGSLFWPTIAAEGSESLDAVSRSFHYVGATPWRTLFYGLVAMAYGALCFLFVRFLAYLSLAAAHVFAGFGTSPFGWWGVREEGANKLDMLWQAPSFDRLFSTAGTVSGVEHFSHWVILIWVFLTVMLVWAFLASFYLCASTVVYFLLRRENDAMDIEDVYLDTYEETDYTPEGVPPAAEPAAPPATEVGVPVTVEGAAVEPAPPGGDRPPEQAAEDQPAPDADDPAAGRHG